MKKFALYLLSILMALNSCSMNEYGEPVEMYYEDWGITVPYQDVSKSKTYIFLKALIDQIDKNQVYLITYPSNDIDYPYVTKFNEYLWNSKEAADFFKRKDCIPVLISTYIVNLKAERDIRSTILDLLLASDIFMSKMNITEKKQLMVLALERAKYLEYSRPGPFTIMISIMLSSNYTPFVEDVKPRLRETSVYYYLNVDDNYSIRPGYNIQANDLIIGYATQFLNHNK
jgi:hypothetical protein